jgi:hypothetical protein
MGFAFTVVAVLLTVLAVMEAVLRLRDLFDLPVFDGDLRYGYLMRPRQSVSPRGTRFLINRHGLRGPDFEDHKPSGTERIAFWGDSMVYGGGSVAEEDLFVRVVERILATRLTRPVEVINVSAPGWGIRNIAAYVDSMGLHDVDRVVWLIPEADFRRGQTSLATYPGFPITKSSLRIIGLLRVLLARLKVRFRRRPKAMVSGPQRMAENIEACERVLHHVKRLERDIVIVLTPHAEGYPSVGDVAAYANVAKQLSIPLLDLAPIVDSHPEYFFDGTHFSPQGHAVVGRRIAEFLAETALH